MLSLVSRGCSYPFTSIVARVLTIVSGYVNVLLVFVPLGILAGVLEWGAAAVFTLNFFAIIPLASILSFATEEISVKLGETLGGLLNATFGNAVELIVCKHPHHVARTVLADSHTGQHHRSKK